METRTDQNRKSGLAFMNQQKNSGNRHSLRIAGKSHQDRGLTNLRKINHIQFPVFKVLNRDELIQLNDLAIPLKINKKEFLYLPFDRINKIFLIKRGSMEIGYLDEEGRELSLEILGPGDIFGQSFGIGFNNAYARTLEDSHLLSINKDDFDYFLERFPQLAFRLIKLFSTKINHLENKLQSFVFKDVKTRICQQLISLYQKAGDEKSGTIRIPLTHRDMARLVGSTRETASVCLAELRKDGIIAYERKKIRINSLEKLRQQLN